MNNTADVIIVGGGVIGCAAAYYLAKKGTSVIVLEQDESIGNGGSGRNGGGVRQSGRDPRELPLAMYAVEKMWPHLSDELGVNVEYHKEGNLRLGKTDRHLEILQGLTDRAAACGLEVLILNISTDPAERNMIWLVTGITFLILAVYSFFWIKYKMKMPVFKSVPMEKVLAMENSMYYTIRKKRGIWK